MTSETLQMRPRQYRQFVAVQYLNASPYLFQCVKSLQGKNDFHFVVTMRSFTEYTRRGIWFLAWATEQQLRRVTKLTFQESGSPGIAKMDDNEPFLHCLYALTHGNPISVRMVAFGLDKIFRTDMLLLRAETDLIYFAVSCIAGCSAKTSITFGTCLARFIISRRQ